MKTEADYVLYFAVTSVGTNAGNYLIIMLIVV